MLYFHTPSNLGRCLRETYRYLLPRLGNILGYPVTLRTFQPNVSPNKASVWQEDGSLFVRLPAARGEASHTYLCLSPAAANDEYCRQISAAFVRLCESIARAAKRSWDIKAQLIREEQFLWDEAILSIIYSGNQKYNALDLLGTAREASIFRYEGAPVRLGIFATWNWYQLRPRLEELGCSIRQFDGAFDLRERLRSDKASHLMADGVSSFYVVTSGGAAVAWVSIPASRPPPRKPEWEIIPKSYHPLQGLLIGRDIVFSVNERGEIFLFGKSLALKWNHAGWHRLAGPALSDLLKSFIPEDVAQRIIDVAVIQSEQRQGALFVVTNDPKQLLKGAKRGVAGQFQGSSLFSVSEIDVRTLSRLSQIDGAVVIDAKGQVLNAGVILELPEETAEAGQGARTAAAIAASKFGVSLKVSHDGPISIFVNGLEVRKAG